MIAVKDKHHYYANLEQPSRYISQEANSCGGSPNPSFGQLAVGFKPTPNSAKLRNKDGVVVRRQEMSYHECGFVCQQYVTPGSLVVDPFGGTCPIIDISVRENFRLMVGDKDHECLQLAVHRGQQHYCFRKNQGTSCYIASF